MSELEFMNVFTWLCACYSREPSKNTTMVYHSQFKDIPKARFKKALDLIVAKESYFPAIATIKKYLEEVPSDAIQIERKKYYIGDWEVPKELPSTEEIDKELKEVLDDRRKASAGLY